MRLTQKVLATKITPLYGNNNTDKESYPQKTLKELLQWGMNGGNMIHGYVMLHGWAYDLGQFMEEYFVEDDSDRYYRVYACNEQMARDLVSVPATAKVYQVPQKDSADEIAKAIAKARKAFEALIDLATCDDALYHDGINLEIKDQAEYGLQILKGVK